MPSALNTSEPDAPRSTTPAADLAADAAAVFAAVSRLQATARSDRETLTRLRAALDAMADTVAKAKADLFAAADAAQEPDIPALLDQLEHQVYAMLELATGTTPPAPVSEGPAEPTALPEAMAASEEPFVAVEERTAAIEEPPAPASVPSVASEPDQVPTVSSVVSGLGGSESAADQPPPEPDAVPEDHAARVARLKAMVEALNASVQQPSPDEPPPGFPEEEPQPEAQVLPEPEVFSAPAEIASEEERSPQLADAAALPPTGGPDPAEARLQQAETAAPQAAPTPPDFESLLPPLEPAPAAARSPQAEAATPPAAIAMQELLAGYEQLEAWPIPAPDEGMAVVFPPKVEFAPQSESIAARLPAPVTTTQELTASTDTRQGIAASPPPATAVQTESVQTAIVPQPATAQAPAAPDTALPPAVSSPAAEAPAPQQADAEFDPADFLFGPEPEPDPAAFLLEPPSNAASERRAASEAGKPAAAAPDPLAPLNAMTEAERIAIFS